jgi:glycosyltransferase involved in cell wall biosynthesis
VARGIRGDEEKVKGLLTPHGLHLRRQHLSGIDRQCLDPCSTTRRRMRSTEAAAASGAPAVSVVIPTYQRRDYVRRAVASVLAQTYEDFELIVVDDGSTDGTELALAGLDERLRYHWQENSGAAAARNTGLRLARGQIVAFLDSDNTWLENHLSVVTQVLTRHPEALLVSTCPDFALAGNASVEAAEVVDVLPRLLLGNPVGYTSCIAVRREALRSVGGFDERLPVWEDSDLWLRVSMRGPFVMLRRRTIEHQVTRGGLKERGIRSGDYLRAIELSVRGAGDGLRRVERSDTRELIARARGMSGLVGAVRALTLRDSETARSAFEDACRLAPDLSRRPEVVLGLIRHASAEPREVLRIAAAAANLWPEPRSDTARYLLGYAFVLALRSRRPHEAASSLAGARALLRPRFLMRTMPLSAFLIRRWIHSRTDRGPESSSRGAHEHGGAKSEGA